MRILAAAALLAAAGLAAAAIPAIAVSGDSPASRLDALKKLAGTWHSKDADGDGKPDVTANYRVTSGGSAVMETLFPGTEEEMITMYYRDGDDLLLTHFCKMGNQPRMKALPAKDPKVLSFDYLDCTNVKGRDQMHMDSLVMTLADDSRLRSEWALWKDGKVVNTITLDLERAGK